MIRPATRSLYRHFAYRFVDNDLIPPGGEVHQTAVNVLALCGGAGFTLGVILSIKYTFGTGSQAFERARQLIFWGDQELAISLAMLVAGLATALSWDSLLPDRRDAHILGSLPLRTRQFCAAKLGAALTVIFLVVGITAAFPAVILTGVAHTWDAQLAAIVVRLPVEFAALEAAGASVFFAFLLLQGLLFHLLPYRAYQRLSPLLQVVLLLGSLTAFLLIPDLAAMRRQGGTGAAWLPQLWFLTLAQQWLRLPLPLDPAFGYRALATLGLTASLSLALYAAGFRRALRKAVEGQLPGRARPGPFRRLAAALLERTLLAGPRCRAVYWFAARTLARNPRHRLMLALYFAAGFVWVVQGLSAGVRPGARSLWGIENPALLTMPVDFALFLLIGIRVLFAIPVELPANWIFRLTERAPAAACLAGARALLWTAALPVTVLPLPLYAALWGWRVALLHTAFLTVVALLLVERLLWRFPKIPFTCSYLPGKANLKVRLGAYFVLFLALSSFLAAVELSMIAGHTAPRVLLLLAGAVLVAVILRRRRIEGELHAFQFEENPHWWLPRLNLGA